MNIQEKFKKLNNDAILSKAKELYDFDKNEHMPDFENCPYSYIVGYINHAAMILVENLDNFE